MAKFGTFKYSEAKYGATANTNGGEVIWIVSVDWDNDGSYDGRNEADRLLSLKIKRGKEHWIKPSGKGLEPTKPGKATLTLDNYDRLYDAWYSSSPLYDYLYPGRKIQIAVVVTATGTKYVLFTGVIMDIRPQGHRGKQTVKVTCGDYAQFLQDQEIRFADALIKTNISDAMDATLRSVNYPGAISLDSDTQPVIVFDPDGKVGLDVMNDLAEACMGQFFVDRSGTARFYSRKHSFPAWTALGQDVFGNDPIFGQPWDGVYNDVYIKVHNKVKEQPSQIYFLPSPRQVPAGDVLTLYPAYPPSSGVQVDSYTGNSAEDGSGTDTTAQLGGSATLGHSRGTVVASNSGATTWLTELIIRGRKWTDVMEEVNVSNATSLASYGKRTMVIDTEYLQDINYASHFCTQLCNRTAYGGYTLVAQIHQRPDTMYSLELLTRLFVSFSDYGYLNIVYIYGIEYEWNSETGQDVTCTLYTSSECFYESTTVTPAPIRIEAMEADAGYQNPAGDPQTLAATALNSAFVLRMYSAYAPAGPFDTTYHGSWVSNTTWQWGPNPQLVYSSFAIHLHNPEGMYDSNHRDRVTIKQAGVYLFLVSINPTQDNETDDPLSVMIKQYDSGDSVVHTSDRLWAGYYAPDSSVPDLNYVLSANLVFSCAAGDYIKIIHDIIGAKISPFTIYMAAVRLGTTV